MKTLLIIGHTFPEPTTTAAGSRMMQLINLFIEEEYQITFASTASISERSADLTSQGVSVKNILLNDTSFDDLILQLKPLVVIFDRYITEEQFEWRITKNVPNALKILDTEDLHFLRNAREEVIKNGLKVDRANIYSEIAKREIASILRCDLSLIISDFELNLLKKEFSVSSKILYYLPFLVEKPSKNAKNTYNFEKRSNFVTVGNLLHKPNVDSVLYLNRTIWPLIKNQMPKAVIHIYGAYAPQQVLELHNEKNGFLIEGWGESIFEIMESARVCLAPIRFGAGLKGKLLDAMIAGTPSVTTIVGAEGMCGSLPYPGVVADGPLEFANASVELYHNKEKWQEAHQNGFSILENRFQKSLFSQAFIQKLNFLLENLKKHRETNFIGQILQHQSMYSTKYMSKWIEEKNKRN